jgi:hypothetical protein
MREQEAMRQQKIDKQRLRIGENLRFGIGNDGIPDR